MFLYLLHLLKCLEFVHLDVVEDLKWQLNKIKYINIVYIN